MEKCGGATQATDDSTAHALGMLNKPTPARAPSHAQAQKYVILLFHNSGYMSAPVQRYTNVTCLGLYKLFAIPLVRANISLVSRNARRNAHHYCPGFIETDSVDKF